MREFVGPPGRFSSAVQLRKLLLYEEFLSRELVVVNIQTNQRKVTRLLNKEPRLKEKAANDRAFHEKFALVSSRKRTFLHSFSPTLFHCFLLIQEIVITRVLRVNGLN